MESGSEFSRRTLIERLVAAALLGGFTGGSAACGGGRSGASSPDPAALPRWEGQLRYLFDDHIAPVAVGLSLEGDSPADDPLLRARVAQADIVARMRVQTLTMDAVGAYKTYTLAIQVGLPTLAVPKIPDTRIEFEIGPDSPSFGIVERLQDQIRGKTFVGLVRRFAGPNGVETHFHLTADTVEVTDAIAQMTTLDQIAIQPSPGPPR